MQKRTKIALISVLTLVALLTSAFIIYVSDYYRADDIVITLAYEATTTLGFPGTVDT